MARTTHNVTTTDDEPELHDVSLEAYLAADDSQVTDKVKTRHGMLKIAAITDDEADTIRRTAERPDPRKGRGAVKLDDQLYKRLLVAKSLANAHGVPDGQILPQLAGKLAGEVTTIALAVMKLSGFDEAGELDRLGESSS